MSYVISFHVNMVPDIFANERYLRLESILSGYKFNYSMLLLLRNCRYLRQYLLIRYYYGNFISYLTRKHLRKDKFIRQKRLNNYTNESIKTSHIRIYLLHCWSQLAIIQQPISYLIEYLDSLSHAVSSLGGLFQKLQPRDSAITAVEVGTLLRVLGIQASGDGIFLNP